MFRTWMLIGVLITVGIGVTSYRAGAQQPAPPDQGQLIPGCDIPKQYGRLVTITSGNNNGLAGQAVFEAEDGTIRWVPFMFSATQTISQRPTRRPSAIFPTLPIFECAVGHVWQRP